MNYPQRMYSKTELGLLYFPDTTDGATARRGLRPPCGPRLNSAGARPRRSRLQASPRSCRRDARR